jgi:hypothetical protein
MVPAHTHWNRRSAGDAAAELSGAALFRLIWESLADLFGTATTAVLIRRAARRGTTKSPELGELEISVRELEYRYTVPPAWSEGAGDTPPALRTLVSELLPLLLELTGRIAIHRLEQIPELRSRGLLAPEVKPEVKPESKEEEKTP